MNPADTTAPRPLSRSALIGGGIGAAIAIAARTLAAPTGAQGASGSALVLGTPNDASSTTGLTVSSGTGLAVSAGGGAGVAGSSVRHPGLRGTSQTGFGVAGSTAARAKSGVLGENRDETGTGVWGRSPAGVGVLGSSRSGTGVRARSDGGLALDVEGTVRFASAGNATIREGDYRTSVVPGVPVTNETRILATLNGPDPERFVGEAASPVTLWFVEAHPGDGSFDIVLTERVQHDVRVSWFVIEG